MVSNRGKVNVVLMSFMYVVLLYLVIGSRVVNADDKDVFTFNLGSSYTHDDNLFKLPSSIQPTGVGAKRSDNILVNNVGFEINKLYSLQKFTVRYTHLENKYDNAKFLDFNANNYGATWHWAITPRLTGILSTDRKESLVGFQDFRNTSVQNIRDAKNNIFRIDWSPFGNWHLLGGASKYEAINSRTFLAETSFKMNAYEAGFKYVFPSTSFIAYKYVNRDGQNQDINFFNNVGKNFTEKENSVSLYWPVTGKSLVTATVGKLTRTDDSFSVRDFSGNFGNLNYAWSVTGKSVINLNVSRRLNSFLLDDASYSILDAIAINPVWYATSKISVNGNVGVSKRKFQGDGPNVIAGIDRREDDEFTYGLGVSWSPRDSMQFGLNFQHNDRNSTFNDRDYKSNSATVSGQLMF